jgi:hypothetical protein
LIYCKPILGASRAVPRGRPSILHQTPQERILLEEKEAAELDAQGMMKPVMNRNMKIYWLVLAIVGTSQN